VEEVLLELSNAKSVEFAEKSSERVLEEGWVSAVEGDVQVFVDTSRDEKLLGEGLMRDVARRVQSLRKESGYVPADVLSAVHVAGLDSESMGLLKPYLRDMEELVRARKVILHAKREGVAAEWREFQLDDKTVFVAIVK
jgi:isoleucyl-tRNA synthetase